MADSWEDEDADVTLPGNAPPAAWDDEEEEDLADNDVVKPPPAPATTAPTAAADPDAVVLKLENMSDHLKLVPLLLERFDAKKSKDSHVFMFMKELLKKCEGRFSASECGDLAILLTNYQKAKQQAIDKPTETNAKKKSKKKSKTSNVWVGENGDIREDKDGQVVGWATKDGDAFGDFLSFAENRMQKDPRLQKKSAALERLIEKRRRSEGRKKKAVVVGPDHPDYMWGFRNEGDLLERRVRTRPEVPYPKDFAKQQHRRHRSGRWARALVEQFTDAQLQDFLQTLPDHQRLWRDIYQVRINPLNYFSVKDLKFLQQKPWQTTSRINREAALQQRRERRQDREGMRSENMLIQAIERAFDQNRRNAEHMEDCKVKADCAGKLVCSPTLKKCITNDEYRLLGSVTRHAGQRRRPRSRRAAMDRENMRRAVNSSRCVYRDQSCNGESDPISLDDISVSSSVRVDKQCYDTAPLRKWLRGNPTLPHNRQPFSPSDLDKCTRR